MNAIPNEPRTAATLAPSGWGVETRSGPGRPWLLVAVATDQQHAKRLMLRLATEARGSSDWRVRRPTNIVPAG